MFGTNQAIQITRDAIFIDNGSLDAGANHITFNLIAGLIIASITAAVELGDVRRIGAVAAKTVPTVTLLYMLATILILLTNFSAMPGAFALIASDAFTGNAVLGGSRLVIQWGIQHGAFSNEADIGMESLAHGKARTNEPVREGLVVMCGPIIDTLLVCTSNTLVILISRGWRDASANGVTLTSRAFAQRLRPVDLIVMFDCIVSFGITKIFTYSFYDSQCVRFLFG